MLFNFWRDFVITHRYLQKERKKQTILCYFACLIEPQNNTFVVLNLNFILQFIVDILIIYCVHIIRSLLYIIKSDTEKRRRKFHKMECMNFTD